MTIKGMLIDILGRRIKASTATRYTLPYPPLSFLPDVNFPILSFPLLIIDLCVVKLISPSLPLLSGRSNHTDKLTLSAPDRDWETKE